jgi:hypothetical protein
MKRKCITICLIFFLVLAIVPLSFPIASNGYTLAYTGTAGPDSSIGSYDDTWEDEMTDYTGEKDTAGMAYVILNFTIAPIQNFGGFNYSVMHGAYNDDDSNSELWVYDWANEDWVYLGIGGQGAGSWTNGTISGARYSDGTEVLIMANSTDSDGGAGVAVQIAWLEIFVGADWLEGYDYRTEIYLNGSTGAGTDYVLKWRVEYGFGADIGQIIHCDKHCQMNFGDIRWTEDDGTTELSYYLDEYTSTGTPPLYTDVDATFYVRISDNLDSDQLIYIYYGTSGTTTTTSNGRNTFFEWLDASDTFGWTKNHVTVSSYGGYLRFYNPTTTDFGYARRSDLSFPADQWRMIIRMKSLSLGTNDRTLIQTYDGLTSQAFTQFEACILGDQTHWYYWDSEQTQGSVWTEGNEYVIYMTVNESDSSTGVEYRVYSSGYAGGGPYDDCDFRSGSPIDADGITIGDGSTSLNMDARVKYFAIMPNLDNEPFAEDYGIEEGSSDFTTSTTTTTTTTTLLSETWGFQTSFVILGLIMIPASSLYLVRGGKDAMSRDKLFYGLIIFFIGWAFFIGGIMP